MSCAKWVTRPKSSAGSAKLANPNRRVPVPMPRLRLAVGIAVLTVVGCDRIRGTQPGTTTDAPDIMLQKPTEEEVRRKVWSRVTPRAVTLLSPLMEVPDSYFVNTHTHVDPAAVACYVAIWSEPNPEGKPRGKATIEFVVIGRDSGWVKQSDRGKIASYQVIEESVARDVFGAEWMTKHPWPKDPGKK